MDGILVIDKPAGMTSHDVVAAVRRLAGEKRVGHAGTLDPMATGVLPVLVGRATKVSDYLMRGDKGYAGTIRFGLETDTLDITGVPTHETDAQDLSEAVVRHAAAGLIGRYDQIPPLYSAIKVKGRALYKSARRGDAMPEPEPRPVEIKAFEITAWRAGRRPEADFRLACSKGTYVRSLARDLGRAVGYPGVLAALRRTKSGGFTLEESVAMERLDAGNLMTYMRPIRTGLTDLPKITVSAGQVASVLNGDGLPLDIPDSHVGTTLPIVVLGPDGQTLAMHEPSASGRTKPIKVIGEGSI